MHLGSDMIRQLGSEPINYSNTGGAIELPKLFKFYLGMSLNITIKTELERRGMSIKELSEVSGVSYATLKRFISADHDISSKKLILILNTLGIDLEALILKGSERSAAQKDLPAYLKKSLTKFIEGVRFGI